MKVLYLTYDGLTDNLGQSQVLPYLIGLSKKGAEITVVSFEKPNSPVSSEHIQNICDQANIEWHALSYHKNPPILSTVLDIQILKKTILKLQLQEHFDIIHCRSYITSIAGEWLKKKTGIKFVFDMRAFYADERVDGKIWNIKNPIYNSIYKFFKRKEKDFLKSADYTITLTHNAKKIINDWPGFEKTKIQVIPCCMDEDLFDANQLTNFNKVKFARDLGIKDKSLVLTYIGSIGTWYMLDEMLLFYKELLVSKPDASFLFVTREPKSLILEKALALNVPSENIIIIPSKREDIPKYLTISDFSIFFILPVFSKQGSSPTKQGEIMSMGKPIICNSGVGDTDFVIEKYNCGALVEEMNHTEFRKAIDKIPDLLALDPVKIREGAIDFYSLQKGGDNYWSVYKKVIS
jgi:glycosyltransferase involved in cell wall biosynthesis